MRLSASLLSVVLLSAILVGLPSPGAAATDAQILTARTKGLAYLYGSQNLDGSWGSLPGLEVATTSAVIEAFRNSLVGRGASFNAALSMLVNADPPSMDGLARQLDTLYHIGNDTSAQFAQLKADANALGAWGTLPGQGSNVADTALALIALLDSGTTSTYTSTSVTKALCAAIIPAQITIGPSAGGWSYMPNLTTAGVPAGLTAPGILPTAYAILALKKAASRNNAPGCNGVTYTLTTLMANGVTWLLTKKNADNGFGDNGTSGALETALAYQAIAVASPGHSALGPAQGYLIDRQQPSGAWASDPLQTALVLQTFPALSTAMTDTDGDGVPDAVAAVLWPSGSGNARSLLAGNGAAVAGVNTPLVLHSTNVGNARSYTLTGSGTFSLVSGNLPQGLSLSANGTLSGVPSEQGTFAFTYQTVDSSGKTTYFEAELTVDPDITWLPAVLNALLGD